MKRRLSYLLLIFALIALGLASRAWRPQLPWFIGEYGGDTLWAMMTYFAVGLLAPRWSIANKAIAALLIAWGVEFSQLYHAPWIDAIRANRFAHLVLGDTFVWSDLVCYTAGVLLGAAGERLFAPLRR